MEFTLNITLGNEAMQTADDVATALRHVVAYLEDYYGSSYIDEWQGLGGHCVDTNGNRVGGWKVHNA